MIKMQRFRLISNSILALFLTIIVYVICIAFMRKSGSTGLDMSAMQKIRYEATLNQSPQLSMDLP